MTLLVAYSVAAWMSLFWINGILSWQLTPGQWTSSRSLWDGFFNPSFWPSLLFRTVVSMTIGGLAACVVISTMTGLARENRTDLIHRAWHFLVFMAGMPILGTWYLAAMPPDSRSWALGGSPAMTMFLGIAIVASLLIGLYAVVGLLKKRLYINAATATLLCALALGATAGGEFVREGVRKPYTIRQTLFANSIRPEEVARLRQAGSVTFDPYPLRDSGSYPNDQLLLGAKVFRFQCSVCHTLHGFNGVAHLTSAWTTQQKRLNIANLQHTKPFMPPFSGNAAELEALVQLLEWSQLGRPPDWSPSDDIAVLAQLDQWLAEAGTAAHGWIGAAP
jgi:mono/diheme cytochrome c family protein